MFDLSYFNLDPVLSTLLLEVKCLICTIYTLYRRSTLKKYDAERVQSMEGNEIVMFCP